MATPNDNMTQSSTPDMDAFYGAVGQQMREQNYTAEERIAYARYLAQLLTERSQAKGRSEKLLVQMRADQMDAAAKMADSIAQIKKARMSGNSDLLKSAVELAGHQMDFLADTSYKVAAEEYATLFMSARQQEVSSAGSNPKHAYWASLSGDMLNKIPTVAGKSYVDAMLLLTQQGTRDWRKELQAEKFDQNDITWQNMERLEREAEAQRKNRDNAQDYINSLLGNINGDGSGSASSMAQLPGEDAAFGGFLADVTGGLAVDKLKAQAADLRSTVNDAEMDNTIKFLQNALGASDGNGANSDYVRTLENPEFQAWAKDHGFVVGTVKKTADGKFDGVQPGKDDYLAAKGYVYQMKRDPTARQRRWRASHDIVRLDWNEGATEGEKPRDPNDIVKAERFVVTDANNSSHVVTRYYADDMSKDLYIDSTDGVTKTLAQVQAIGTIEKDSLVAFVLSDEKGLVHKSALDAPDKLNNYMKLTQGEADVRLAAESSELKKSTDGSPQYAYGVDLGLAGGHGVRVFIDEDGKRRTAPASAKVTRLESLTPEHISELDKLRANRVNQAVKRTDALTSRQKEQQLGTLDEPMSLKEKIGEARKQDMVENKAARERENEAQLPSSGNVVAVGEDLEINEDSHDKAAAPVATKHAEGAQYTDARTARQIEAYPAQEAARIIEDKKVFANAEKENKEYPQGIPTSATLTDPDSGMSGVPGSEGRGRVLEGVPDSTGHPTKSLPVVNPDAIIGPRSTAKMREANATSERAGGLPSPVLSRKQLSHNPGKFLASTKQAPEEVVPRSLRATAWGKARREERLQRLGNKASEELDNASTSATDAARKMVWDEERRAEEEKNKAMRQAIEYGIAGQSKLSP